MASQMPLSVLVSITGKGMPGCVCVCGLQAMTVSLVTWLWLIIIGKYLTAYIYVSSRCILWMPWFIKHSYHANEPDILLLDLKILTVVYCFASLSKHSAVLYIRSLQPFSYYNCTQTKPWWKFSFRDVPFQTMILLDLHVIYNIFRKQYFSVYCVVGRQLTTKCMEN